MTIKAYNVVAELAFTARDLRTYENYSVKHAKNQYKGEEFLVNMCYIYHKLGKEEKVIEFLKQIDLPSCVYLAALADYLGVAEHFDGAH